MNDAHAHCHNPSTGCPADLDYGCVCRCIPCKRIAEANENEYSHPPEGKGRHVDLSELGVQVTPLSKRRVATTRIYRAALSDAAIARIRAKTRGGA